MNSFYSNDELAKLGFKTLGENLQISRWARFYRCDTISIGSNTRIDDFTIITGSVTIGNFCHITPHCIMTGSANTSILISDYCTFAYRSTIFSQTDDYTGPSMTGSVVNPAHVNPYSADVFIAPHSIVGASSVVMPGVHVAIGTAIGAMSFLNSNTEPWTVYAGIPARRIRIRQQFPEDYLTEYSD